MSGFDVLRVQGEDFDTVTISVGRHWIELPTQQVDALVTALQNEVAA